MKNKNIINQIQEILFIISLLPLLLNWILGFFIFHKEKEKIYIYRSAFNSVLFISLSSSLFLIFLLINEYIITNSLINYIFFILQVFLVLAYFFISIALFISYYKNSELKILYKLDLLYQKFLEIL